MLQHVLDLQIPKPGKERSSNSSERSFVHYLLRDIHQAHRFSSQLRGSDGGPRFREEASLFQTLHIEHRVEFLSECAQRQGMEFMPGGAPRFQLLSVKQRAPHISYLAGSLSDRWARRNVLLASFVVFFVAYLGFARTRSVAAIAALFVFYGLFQGIFRSVSKALASDFVPDLLRASAGTARWSDFWGWLQALSPVCCGTT